MSPTDNHPLIEAERARASRARNRFGGLWGCWNIVLYSLIIFLVLIAARALGLL